VCCTGAQQEELDSTLAELGPIFSARLLGAAPGSGPVQGPGQPAVGGGDEKFARASEQLEQR